MSTSSCDEEKLQAILLLANEMAMAFCFFHAVGLLWVVTMENRDSDKGAPEDFQQKVADSQHCFPNAMAEFVYYRTYSRWIEAKGRRETWVETVKRYMAYMHERLGDQLNHEEYVELHKAILSQAVMPSMRLLWAAGDAARSTHVAAYNCAYIAPTSCADLAEIMYLLMCGTGVGFSVEKTFTQLFPIIKPQIGGSLGTHVVGDSRESWGEALKAGLTAWFDGNDLNFDFSHIRPAGARLLTMGGRSSGPEPLKSLLDYGRTLLLARQGRKLTSLELHDLICRIGEVVAMGGVRRSALMSLSDLDDDSMRYAKSGDFYREHPERSLANNSAVYCQKPQSDIFLEEWLTIAKGGTGERGIFNRGGLTSQLPTRRWPLFALDANTCGTNPCGEIILKSKQFCNLSEVVARPHDTVASLLDKVRIAAILGTYQSTLTHFPYLSLAWRKNCEEERLLGVSLTGQWDCPLLRDAGVLDQLKRCAVATNDHYARRFGINPSAAVTCVKPSGTVSLVVDAASGMHPRFAKYYIRRIRVSATDPLFAMLAEQKFPYLPERGQVVGQATTYVLEFPMRAPDGAVVKADLSALQQLEHWKLLKKHYTEHNPSITIYVKRDEWIEVANWLYSHWEILGGLSFLPYEGGIYQLAPYEEISQEEYEERLSRLPKLDFSKIVLYENDDQTIGSQFFSCVGAACELDPEEGSRVMATAFE